MHCIAPSKRSNYRWCIVPLCSNTSVRVPEKLFIHVPFDETRRRAWFKACRRKTYLSAKSVLYCCEDHFNLEEDIENYTRFRLIGGPLQIRKDVLPHKFDCQNRNYTSSSKLQSAALKRKELECVEQPLNSNNKVYGCVDMIEDNSDLAIGQESSSPLLSNSDISEEDIEDRDMQDVGKSRDVWTPYCSKSSHDSAKQIGCFINQCPSPAMEMFQDAPLALIKRKKKPSSSFSSFESDDEKPCQTIFKVEPDIRPNPPIKLEVNRHNEIEGYEPIECNILNSVKREPRTSSSMLESDGPMKSKAMFSVESSNNPDMLARLKMNEPSESKRDPTIEYFKLDLIKKELRTSSSTLQSATMPCNTSFKVDPDVDSKDSSDGGRSTGADGSMRDPCSSKEVGAFEFISVTAIKKEAPTDSESDQELTGPCPMSIVSVVPSEESEQTHEVYLDSWKQYTGAAINCDVEPVKKKPVRRRPPDGIYPCGVCGKTFTRKNNLKQHETTHSEDMPFSCSYCEKCFARKGDLKRHSLVHTGEKRFSCPDCGKCFANKQNMLKHRFIHTGQKPFACTLCDDRFADAQNLKRHLLKHTGERPFSCDVCRKTFRQRIQLTQHALSHTGERPFACPVCGKTYAWKQLMREHTLVHAGEKPFPCDECGQRFADKPEWKKHVAAHVSEKPFACDQCDKRFKLEKLLKQHTVTHSLEKLFVCKECGKGFTRKQNLKDHVTIHTGDKPYECDVCGEGFKHRQQVKRHARAAHSSTC